MAIQGIDAASIHRLTSGQVVTDLQTCVKELVENSLDAGATTIDVRFKNYGLASIEVIDNGSGIAPADYDSIALKHYTSKLLTFEDIAAVRTFGFRGEALSSLCALCESVTVTTATRNEAPMGAVLEFDSRGRVKSRSGKVARQRGTTATLTKLFAPLPVRRKDFEKNAKREFGKALNLLQAYALVPCTFENGGVRFTVSNQLDAGGRKTQMQTKGTGAIQNAVSALWGPKAMDNVVPLDIEFDVEAERSALKRIANLAATTHVKLSGLVSKFAVGCGRQGSDRQYLFVNGRPCTLPKVQRAVNEAYRQFNATQTPFVVMNIIVPTETCDINVSPDKRTIFLHNEQNFIAALKDTLEHAFADTRSTFSLNSAALFASQAGSVRQHESEENEDTDEDDADEDANPPPTLPRVAGGLSIAQCHPSSSKLPNSSSSPPWEQADEHQAPHIPRRPSGQEMLLFLPEDDEPVAPLPSGKQSPDSVDGEGLPSRRVSEADMELDDDNLAVPISDTPPPPPKKTVQTLLSTWALPKPTGSSGILSAKRPWCNEMELAAAVRSPRKQAHSKRFRAISLSPEAAAEIGTPQTITVDIELDDFVDAAGEPASSALPNAAKELAPQRSRRPIHKRTTSPPSHLHFTSHDSASTIPLSVELVDLTEDNGDFNQHSRPGSDKAIRPSYSVGNGDCNTSSAAVTVALDLNAISESWKAGYAVEGCQADPVPSLSREDAGIAAAAQVAEEKLSRIIHKADFPRMEIIGQFNLGFIVARLRSPKEDHDDDLFIIDQHASDEKFNFETLQQTTKMETQRLLRPRSLELTAADELLAIDHIDVLRKNGFDLVVDEDAPAHQRVKLTAIPVSKNTTFDVQDLEELIHALRDTAPGQTARCSKVRAMFAMRACRKSVMIGDALTMRRMKEIVLHMGTMDQPWTCPHGRPTMRHLTSLGHVQRTARGDIDWNAFMDR